MKQIFQKMKKKITGIVERCVLEGIGDYHPIKNPSVDAVHDVLEGICR